MEKNTIIILCGILSMFALMGWNIHTLGNAVSPVYAEEVITNKFSETHIFGTSYFIVVGDEVVQVTRDEYFIHDINDTMVYRIGYGFSDMYDASINPHVNNYGEYNE